MGSLEQDTVTGPSVYQHIVVEGLPYDRGLSHGTQVKDKIHTNVAYYKLPGKLPCWSICSRIINDVYLPAFEKLWPSGLQELRGIAEGADVPLEEIIMLNARYDLARTMYLLKDGGRADPEQNGSAGSDENELANECTSGFFTPKATESGDSLAVQNWDMSNHLHEQDLVIYLEVHPHPSEKIPAMFILTEAGQLIRTGMNAAGLAVTANSLLSTADYVPIPYTDRSGVFHNVIPRPALPFSLARRVFLEYTTYSEGLVAINAFPRHVSGNLHVSTGEGFGMALEVAPDRIYKYYGDVDDNYVLHSNHFVAEGFNGRDDVRDRYPGGSSWFRMRRAEIGVRPYEDGRLTVERIHKAFSDHLSYPESLCQHPNFDARNAPSNALTGYTSKLSMTVAFVVYNLTRKTITVCKGPPCQGHLQVFKLEERAENKNVMSKSNNVKVTPI
ncbi:uncharacterized protein E0L32_000795 [Thyridium curvatum]|uniref:Peptidase C45 hydrolase domain-containing protein n=1 Tax=Thyridium curvatum TaxID=1093900 RepID=A0A507B778_9PEZI|nr:uncharacterized protein E0L32_000795 [Thyridium curvatum]TPX12618.1 hypothetical protein E0L32_000795 [Thyridium curvatum]